MALGAPFMGAVLVTASASKTAGDGIYVVANGNLAFVTAAGQTIAAFAVTAGQLIPFRVREILAGTTATILVGQNP